MHRTHHSSVGRATVLLSLAWAATALHVATPVVRHPTPSLAASRASRIALLAEDDFYDDEESLGMSVLSPQAAVRPSLDPRGPRAQ